MQTKPSRKRRLVKYLLAGAGGTGLLLLLFVAACDQWVQRSGNGRVYGSVDDVPAKKVALLLGTSRHARGGRVNLYFAHRMDAAADLYRKGKVKHILASGDNHVKSYNEPIAMRDALVERGVPAEAITLDYAGFRTLDSVVRCKEVFGREEVVVVSQDFHNRRALFLCDRYGIDAVAFNAEDVPTVYQVKGRLRECLARCKAVLDVYVLGTKPKFLGDPVDIPA